MDFFRRVIYFLCFFLIIVDCGCNQVSVIQYELEHQVLLEVNRHRLSKGLKELVIDERVAEIARDHSVEMSDGKIKIGHEGASHRFESVSKKGLSWVCAAENVAYISKYRDPVKETVEEWILSSKGYRQNMEGEFNLTGIGVVKNRNGDYYFTQIFIKTH